MLTPDDWIMIANAVLKRTKTFDLEWFETNDGPPNTRSFRAQIDDTTTLSIWGYRTGYSYLLELTKAIPGESIFTDRKRATTKKNADGIDFSGLLKSIQKQIVDNAERAMQADRDRAFEILMAYTAFPSAEEALSSVRSLCSKESIYDTLESFTAEQWATYFNLLTEKTEVGAVAWTRVKNSVEDEEFEASVGDAMQVSLARSEYSEQKGYFLHIVRLESIPEGVEEDQKDRDLFEADDSEIDGENRRYPAFLSLEKLFAAASKPLREQEAQFRKIVKDDLVLGVLAALNAQATDSLGPVDS